MTAAAWRGAAGARPAPTALAALLGHGPPAPRKVAAAIGIYEDQLAFERIVRDCWPRGHTARTILDVRNSGERRETTRVCAFIERFSAEYFPLVPGDAYAEVVGEVPFERLGFTYDDVEEYGGRLGYLMLIVAVLGDTTPGLVAHCETLRDEAGIAPDTLALIPADQRDPDELDAALAGGPYAAAADLARWLYGTTGSCFLDLTWEMQVLDNEGWTRAFVDELRAQWLAAEPLIARVDALATLLESDPDARFAALLREVGAISAERAPGTMDGSGDVMTRAADGRRDGGGDGADRAP